MTATLHQGDAVVVMNTLAAESIQLVVTSPPFWGLRDYNVDGQLGLEKLHDCLGWATQNNCGECYVCHLREVMRAVWRVLRSDGLAFVNLGDSFAGNSDGQKTMSTSRYRLRADLTPKQIAYVLAELAKAREISAATQDERE